MESKTRKIAEASLLAMGTGFVAMLPFQEHAAARLLAGGFEAGLVGGLADWFAVTALFRHPLGIPIPHTALIPQNRDKMTDALVTMVQNNLLNKESIVEKLKEFQAAERILDYAEAILRSDVFRSGLKRAALAGLAKPADGLWAKAVPGLAGYARSRDWVGLMMDLAGEQENVTRLGGRILDYAVDKGTDLVITEDTRRKLGRMAIQAITSLRMNGLMQFAVNAALNYFDEDQIGGAIQQTLVIKLRELGTEGHPSRTAVLDYIAKEWDKLKASESFRSEWNAKLGELAGNWVEGEQPLRLLRSLQDSLIVRIRDGQALEEHVLPLLEQAASRLRQDEALMASFNTLLQDTTVRALEANHSRIGGLVRENIDKMSNDDLIELVEEKAGKDLQWIRVNGALCGFILGLVFTSVRMFV